MPERTTSTYFKVTRHKQVLERGWNHFTTFGQAKNAIDLECTDKTRREYGIREITETVTDHRLD